jgi:5'-3' exonuclease
MGYPLPLRLLPSSPRHEALVSYKAQRGPSPPGFTPDLRNLQLLLGFMRVHTLSMPGYEADDVLAGTAQQAAAAGYAVRIYSSDQDLWQVCGCCFVLLLTTHTDLLTSCSLYCAFESFHLGRQLQDMHRSQVV